MLMCSSLSVILSGIFSGLAVVIGIVSLVLKLKDK